MNDAPSPKPETPSPPVASIPPVQTDVLTIPEKSTHADRKLLSSEFRPALAALVMFVLLTTAQLWRPDTVFTGAHNPQIEEAIAWWNGRLDLPQRTWDTALYNGRVYSHFPPCFTFISALIVPFFQGIPQWMVVIGLYLSMPLIAFRMFRASGAQAGDAAILAIAMLCGTSAWPVLDTVVRSGSVYFINHALSLIGLMLLIKECLGQRRVGIAGVGFTLSALSRQLTLPFAIPLIWMAWHGPDPTARTRRCILACTTIALVGSAYATMNWLKFGNPLDNGYMYLYEDRGEDNFSRDARAHGLFSTHYVTRNLYWMNVGLPRMNQVDGRYYVRPNLYGTGIWWTSPILVWLIVDFRRILRDPARRLLLLAAGLAVTALLLYHSTGYAQRGFNRYSLDYLPALFAVIAPACLDGRRRWITCGMVAWSVVYFRWLI